MKLFRYSPKDAYLFLYTLAMLALPYYMAVYTEPSVWWILVGAVQSYLIANLQNTSLHHHTHWPTFNSNRLNSYYAVLISAASGVGQQAWKTAHLLHHKYVNDPLDNNGKTYDPASVFKFGKNQEPANFWVFIWKFGWPTFVSMFRTEKILSSTPNQPIVQRYQQQYSKEQIAIKIFLLSIFVINFWYGVALLVVYFLAHLENFAISYGEHYGVLDRRGDTTQDSVGSYNWFINFIGFGAGYHQEHHHRPGIHWTNLQLVTPILHPDRKLIPGLHIMNNPFWTHFKLLFKKI
jgi:fatty acid desaturase